MRPLTLATWNVLHGMRVGPRPDGSGQPQGVVDLDGLLAGARQLDADVLGMQEVDSDQPRSGGTDQTGRVAEAVGAVDWRFVPALEGTPGETWRPSGPDHVAGAPAYGVGLVSRLPVAAWHVHRFPAARASLPLLVPGAGFMRVRDEPRVGVAAVVELPEGGQMTVATCHLSFVPGANVRQLRELCRWLSGLPGPRVLLGDLNLPGQLPRLVSRWQQLARTPTYPSWGPRIQWDHALGHELDGLAVTESSAVRGPVSDHWALRIVLGR